MDLNQISPDPWLQLGIAGAGMFIVLVVVLLVFANQTKNISRLCEKIDELVTEISKDQIELAKMVTASNKDQTRLNSRIDSLFDRLSEIHKRVIRIDTRLYERGEYDFNTREGEES